MQTKEDLLTLNVIGVVLSQLSYFVALDLAVVLCGVLAVRIRRNYDHFGGL